MVETSLPVIGYRGIEGIGWKVRTLSSSHVFASERSNLYPRERYSLEVLFFTTNLTKVTNVLRQGG